jgi:hypothetical protein
MRTDNYYHHNDDTREKRDGQLTLSLAGKQQAACPGLAGHPLLHDRPLAPHARLASTRRVARTAHARIPAARRAEGKRREAASHGGRRGYVARSMAGRCRAEHSGAASERRGADLGFFLGRGREWMGRRPALLLWRTKPWWNRRRAVKCSVSWVRGWRLSGFKVGGPNSYSCESSRFKSVLNPLENY